MPGSASICEYNRISVIELKIGLKSVTQWLHNGPAGGRRGLRRRWPKHQLLKHRINSEVLIILFSTTTIMILFHGWILRIPE